MTKPGQRRISWSTRLITLFVALLLAYVVSPYLSFWLFTRAIKANDRAALESHVDFASVRGSLKDELRGRIPKAAHEPQKNDRFSGLMARLAPTLIDQLVDAFVTPEGLAAFLNDPALRRQAKAENPAALTDIPDYRREVKWSNVRRAFFTGVKTFTVDFEGTKLEFRVSQLHWRLKKIHLPPNE
ncbi:MAG: DUF2939 domain-containing protein [Verrucomicrobiota bacterium]|nr:DUF2939 domain-containing protein [Verrucomicrobiota bacterium]